ncbi:MAG: hypothetical protein HY587_00375 [Candidatus Omnitrophica bacterium]|nr:hypothetical protein [Candidatus Omnitrophota bacterium]
MNAASQGLFRVIMISVLILLLTSLATTLVLRTSGLKQITGEYTVPFDPTLEIDYHSRYGSLSRDFSASILDEDVSASSQRNLFERYRPGEDFFKLVDIRLEPLALTYKGRIEQHDGSLIAQVNWAERTYFVKEGESIDGWRIKSIQADALTVENSEGEILALPYLETTYRKERLAVIYNGHRQEEAPVLLGGIIEGYTVSAITEDSVTLSGKETFTLRLTPEEIAEGAV